MSAEKHVVSMREMVGNWLNAFADKNETQLSVEGLINLIESLGYSTKLIERSQETNDKDATKHRYLIVHFPAEVEGKPTKYTQKENNETKTVSPTKLIPARPQCSPKRSPLQDIEISVNMGNITTSSPIKPTNKVTDMLNKIINLAKDALDMVTDSNTTYSKPVFMRKRISDIHISPKAANQNENQPVVDLNVTKTKENPSMLKTTPRKSLNSSYTTKKSLPKPQASLQIVRSKLRTPSQLKASPSITLTRSASSVSQKGTPSGIPGAITERRLGSTPLRRETPIGLSRLRHPSVVKK